MSECAILYVQCRQRYGGIVDNPAWFMSLYKKMVSDRFTDLSNKNTRQANAFRTFQPIPVHDLDFEMNAKLQYASLELRQVLFILNNAPTEILSALAKEFKTPKKIFYVICRKLSINNTKAEALEVELQTLLR